MAKKKNAARKQAAPVQQSGEAPEDGDGSGDPSSRIFNDPTIEQTVAEDPLFAFLKEWWRQLLVAAALIFGGMYVRDAFHETYVTNMRRAADIFAVARDQYQALILQQQQIETLEGEVAKLSAAEGEAAKKPAKGEDAKEGEKSELEKKREELTELKSQYDSANQQLQASVAALQDERSPYKEFGKVYEGLLAIHAKELDRAEQVLRAFDWKAVPAEDHQMRFVTELASMALARAYLSDDSKAAEGKAMLTALVESGSFAHVSALSTLTLLATDESEREGLRELLARFAQAHPEQNELLTPLEERLAS